MPYSGRPSAGCQICRQRKIKCDEREPACENCAKAGWSCPGYRNMIDLLFRDESTQVAERAQCSRRKVVYSSPESVQRLKADGKPSARPEDDELVSHTDLGRKSISRIANPGIAPRSDLDELAIGFVFHYYVFGSQSQSRLTLEDDSCLLASIKALGAAGVTRSGHGRPCSVQVQSRYGDAIQLVNTALRSPRDVRKDSTLLAVNILGVFETMIGTRRTLESWYNHIHGAAALLQHRGITQLESAEGGRLFIQTTTILALSCLRRRLPIPAHIHELFLEAAQQVPDPGELSWLCFHMTLRFADLYAKLLPSNMVYSAGDALPILEEAFNLDLEIKSCLDGSSDDLHPRKIPAAGPSVFAGYVYAFRYSFAAQLYNAMLWKRIVLQDIMVKALQSLRDQDLLGVGDLALRHIQNASQTICQLQHKILASVPQHLESSCSHIDYLSPFATDPEAPEQRDPMWPNFYQKDQNPWRFQRTQSPGLPFVRMGGGFTIQWALYVAGSSDAADGDVRKWVIAVLRSIGRKMGMQQAVLLANSLQACTGEQLDAHLRFRRALGLTGPLYAIAGGQSAARPL